MMELEILGVNFSCDLGSLAKGKFPHKDCLLPLISKLLGYCIVAASTTVKVPQNKSTGELSFLTCFLNFGGSLVRFFTSIQENAPISDMFTLDVAQVILGSVIGIAMNGTILSQILFPPEIRSQEREEKAVNHVMI